MHSKATEKSRYTNLGPRFEDSFCGNVPVLRHVLDFNGIRDVTILDAATTALGKIPGKYDLIYSFYCIGFHWALEYFIDDIKNLLSASGVAIFTTTSDFRPLIVCKISPTKLSIGNRSGPRTNA